MEKYSTEWYAERQRVDHMQFANKLNNLALLIENHPEYSWSTHLLGMLHVSDATEMLRVANELGGKWDKKQDEWSFDLIQMGDDDHFSLIISAGRSAICEQVGTEEIETVHEIDEDVVEAVKAGETTYTTVVTKKIWKCPESLLALAADNDSES